MDPLSAEDRQGSGLVKRSTSHASDSFGEKAPFDAPTSAKDNGDTDAEQERRNALYAKLRPILLVGLAAAILGWWISATVLEATRHRWRVNPP
jgi:concentrative nucleoside transporter, CNT family